MPGRDWRAAVGAPARVAAPAAPRLPELPAPVQRLLEQRRELERRMREVTGAGKEDPRLAALYQVRPLAERRAEHEQWQSAREEETRRAAQLAHGRRVEEVGETARRLDRPAPGEPALGPSTLPLRATPGEHFRPRERTRPRHREASDTDAFMTAREKLGGLARQSRDLDARRDELRRQGHGEAADAIDRALADTGTDKILKGAEKLDRVFDRAATTSTAPERAERVIEDDWLKRRDRIGGPDLHRYERGFRARAERLLKVDTGSIAELQERMERQRERGLDRRRAAREEERRDEERRERALTRRRERGDER